MTGLSFNCFLSRVREASGLRAWNVRLPVTPIVPRATPGSVGPRPVCGADPPRCCCWLACFLKASSTRLSATRNPQPGSKRGTLWVAGLVVEYEAH